MALFVLWRANSAPLYAVGVWLGYNRLHGAALPASYYFGDFCGFFNSYPKKKTFPQKNLLNYTEEKKEGKIFEARKFYQLASSEAIPF